MRSHRIIKAITILRTPRERRSAPKKSISFSEKEDLRRHEVLTEPERKLDFALLENCVQKKTCELLYKYVYRKYSILYTTQKWKTILGQKRKRAPVFGTGALDLISLTELRVASTEFFQDYTRGK